MTNSPTPNTESKIHITVLTILATTVVGLHITALSSNQPGLYALYKVLAPIAAMVADIGAIVSFTRDRGFTAPYLVITLLLITVPFVANHRWIGH